MIRQLDQKTIDKIAAGEVIERPLSVVKELVENSVDAGSTRITVEIRDGGIDTIRVTDNGCGIDKDEVRTAYLSHATSKLETAEDLVGIGTLGFRGEALSTIAAVTRTEMVTKTHDSMVGVKYVINGGVEEELTEVGAPDGTTIISKNIFYNTPARLKFLKTPMTEGSYISDLINHMALANPEIAFKLISNGKTLISTSGDGRLKETIYALYGSDITKSILPVDYTCGNIHITGYIGKPFLSKGNRSFENYFVNKRYIKSSVINTAIEEAYKTYVMQHRFPFTVLFLELDPESCDVNIHPAKREFRYSNEKELFHAVFHAVHDTLQEKHELIPEAEADYKQREKIYTPLNSEPVAPKAAPQPTSFASSRSGSFAATQTVPQPKTSAASGDVTTMLDAILPKDYREKLMSKAEESSQNSDIAAAPDTGAATANIVETGAATANTVETTGSANAAEETSVTGTAKDVLSSGSYSILNSILPKEYKAQNTPREEFVQEESSFSTRKSSEPVQADARNSVQQNVSEQGTQQELQLGTAQYLSKEALSKHIIIGQVFKTYWLTEYNNELYIMDQHAAHEKVNYETYLAEFKERRIESQQLFPPMMITLSAAEKAAVMDNIDYFTKSGFELEDFGGNEVKITSIPINLIGLGARDIFLEFAEYLSNGITGLTEDIFVRKLATMGCKAAIKGNQEISRSEAETLIEKLLTLDNPYTCPHGRPTIIRISKEELERKFKRIVE